MLHAVNDTSDELDIELEPDQLWSAQERIISNTWPFIDVVVNEDISKDYEDLF